ncbi:MAG: NAD(P)H-hydrate dehydratase [Bernardetiaceae bacterium]|nr:NAD(P)H-hydrate dehydratase [Bernardetiaceae bacterium]
MKILTSQQIREADAYTIKHEPISSNALMQRAANAASEWIMNFAIRNQYKSMHVVCGLGNNGGDGLVIARYLSAVLQRVYVSVLHFSDKHSEDFDIELEKLKATDNVHLHHVQQEGELQDFEADLTVDAVFGSGLNRPLEGLPKRTIAKMNQHKSIKIAIDIPSGLFAEQPKEGQDTVFQADYTLSFQVPKLAFLLDAHYPFVGEWTVLDIKLHPEFLRYATTDFWVIDKSQIKRIFRPRKPYAHKGMQGHALLAVGSYQKTGAAILAAQACLRSGCGLLSVHVPKKAMLAIQTSLPEAMLRSDAHQYLLSEAVDSLSEFAAIGIGCGIGQAQATQSCMFEYFEKYGKPMLIDADALNIIAKTPHGLSRVPKGSILTPHPKEFSRLFGESQNPYQAIEKLRAASQKYEIVIVLKGKYTAIGTADGRVYFHVGGNAGMAKGGSGDALSGIITALLAQGYPSEEAAILGVWLHGSAGDKALAHESSEALHPSDLIANIGTAFRSILDE